MRIVCRIGLHSWSLCKCTRCGQTRHDWDGCKCRTFSKVLREHVNEVLKGNATGLFGGGKTQRPPSPTEAARETVWRKGNLAGLTAGTRWATVGGRRMEFLPDEKADRARHKANIDHKTRHEAQNRLIRAAQSGERSTIKAMIKAGADVNAQGAAGKTALLKAAENGELDCLRVLIAAGADVNATDNRGTNSLVFAARSGSLDCIKALISAGLDVKNTNGYTALMLAADNGHADCAKAIVAAAGARF
jgi:hypothetical protein